MRAFLIAGLGYGDEGKGALVDYLARTENATLVVRYNGGAQAAHNVVLPDGRHHCFAQFGSATFVPGVLTFLSRFMVVNPIFLLSEEEHLRSVGVDDAFDRLVVDARAPVTTPFHVAANRLRELARGDARHGSCGMGVGETVADTLAHGEDMLFAGDLLNEPAVEAKLRRIQDMKRAEIEPLLSGLRRTGAALQEWLILSDPSLVATALGYYRRFRDAVTFAQPDFLSKRLREHGTTIWEGAQGVLLDEDYGFHPYTTWSKTTYANAETLLAEAGFSGAVTKLGALRAYMTRHGAGPFVTEDPGADIFSEGDHNGRGPWQGTFRSGHFDLVAARYAIDVADGRRDGIDGLVLSHLDRVDSLPMVKVCGEYMIRGESIGRLCVDRHRPPSLGRQTRLGELLREARPNYIEASSDPKALVSFIESALNVPVRIRSFGPTWQDRSAAP